MVLNVRSNFEHLTKKSKNHFHTETRAGQRQPRSRQKSLSAHLIGFVIQKQPIHLRDHRVAGACRNPGMDTCNQTKISRNII
jgi:hypothetical protein